MCEHLIPRIRHEPRRTQVVIYDGLRRLSGLDIDDRPALWEAWWRSHGAALAEKAAGSPDGATAADADPTTAPDGRKIGARGKYDITYYGLPVRSDRILFLLDISMSMRYGGLMEDPNRIEMAKAELVKVLRRLDPEVKFNILVFSTGNAYLDRKKLIAGTKPNRKRAEAWVQKLVAAGGTNSYGALKAGFDRFPDVDTIYFLSDGRPSRGMITDPELIIARVKEMNLRRRVRIHTIALVKWNEKKTSLDLTGGANDAARFMENLAESADGRFVRKD